MFIYTIVISESKLTLLKNITIWIIYFDNKNSPRLTPNGEFRAGMRDSKDSRPEVGW